MQLQKDKVNERGGYDCQVLHNVFMQGLVGAGTTTTWSQHSFSGLEDTDTPLICYFLCLGAPMVLSSALRVE